MLIPAIPHRTNSREKREQRPKGLHQNRGGALLEGRGFLEGYGQGQLASSRKTTAVAPASPAVSACTR